jgi:hypothetical protein
VKALNVTCECGNAPREIIEHDDGAGVKWWTLGTLCTGCLNYKWWEDREPIQPGDYASADRPEVQR